MSELGLAGASVAFRDYLKEIPCPCAGRASHGLPVGVSAGRPSGRE
jgi:hypothetical protein